MVNSAIRWFDPERIVIRNLMATPYNSPPMEGITRKQGNCDRTGYLRNRDTAGRAGETVENQRRGPGNG